MPEPASAASIFRFRSPGRRLALSAGDVICAVGATASSLSTWVRTGSALPAESQERNFTVVVSVIENGPLYAGEVGVGSDPAGGERGGPRPPPPSGGGRGTENR